MVTPIAQGSGGIPVGPGQQPERGRPLAAIKGRHCNKTGPRAPEPRREQFGKIDRVAAEEGELGENPMIGISQKIWLLS